MGGGNSSHLVHPGAVLCMIDLLPAVQIRKEAGHQNKEVLQGNTILPLFAGLYILCGFLILGLFFGIKFDCLNC